MNWDYPPVAECKHPNETYGEICIQCNDCGRFDKRHHVEIRLITQAHSGIPPLWDYPEKKVSFFNNQWHWGRKRRNPTSSHSGTLTDVLPPSWFPGRLDHVRWWIEGRTW